MFKSRSTFLALLQALIALARVLYSTAQFVLLDDPFAALDHKVATEGDRRLEKTVALTDDLTRSVPTSDRKGRLPCRRRANTSVNFTS